jgi:hypothetical protein
MMIFPVLSNDFGSGVVAQSAVASSALTGTTDETALATIALPAGLLGTTRTLRVTAYFTMTANTNVKTPRIRLGGISGTSMNAAVSGAAVSAQIMRVEFSARGSTTSQIATGTAGRGSDNIQTLLAHVSGAQNTAIALDLVISGQLANSGDSLILERYVVEIVR